LILYIVLFTGAAIMLLPFVWMLSTSLKTGATVMQMPPQWIPTDWAWSNYPLAWHTAPFARYFFNSFFMSAMTTIGEVLFTILAAYAFAKMTFWGKNALFTLLLGTLMVPGQMLLIPNFVTITRLGWLDSYQALIIPWLASVFAIFLLRQFFRSLPDELWDSARMDGCGRFRFLWRILVPLAKPAIVTVAILKFIGGWNSYLWVLIMTNSEMMRTVPVGLMNFSTEVGTQHELLMAASVLAVLPILILYFFTQKQFIKSFARTGIK
jgi:multiple sugar transport system permease protein